MLKALIVAPYMYLRTFLSRINPFGTETDIESYNQPFQHSLVGVGETYPVLQYPFFIERKRCYCGYLARAFSEFDVTRTKFQQKPLHAQAYNQPHFPRSIEVEGNGVNFNCATPEVS